MDAHLNELRLDLDEVKKFESLAQREGTKARLTVWRAQLETEIKNLETPKENKPDTKPKESQKKRIFTKKITTYAWDQSDKFIKIYVSNLKGVQDIPRDNVTINYEGQHYVLNVNELNGSNHQLMLPKLLHEVSEANVKIKTDELVILLKKAKPQKWDTLSEKEKKEKDEKEKPPKLDKNEDPGKGIMDMMKKMYDEGDDEMKRTIAKAWTESRQKQEKGEFGM